MGFSLNTSLAEESDGGSVGDDSIEESFWQTNLWPIANHNHQSPPPPPSTSGGRINAPAFVFPLLDDGVGGEHKEVEAAPAGKGEDKDEEEEIKSTMLTINGRKRRSDDDKIATDHVNGERERRKKMRSMFTTLQSFLPHLSHKVDKATIVDEAINLIKTQQTTIQDLQHKAERLHGRPNKAACVAFEPLSSTAPQLRLAGQTSRESFLADYGLGPSSKPKGPSYVEPGRRVMFQTWTSSNVVLNTFGKNEALIMACSRKKPGVLTAIVAVLVKHKVEVEGLHTFCNGDQCSYMIHARLANGDLEERLKLKAEEVYKEAVSEIILLVVDNVVKGEA